MSERRVRLVALVVAGGLLTISFETFWDHRPFFEVKWFTLLPPLASGLGGLLLALAALLWRERWRRVVAGLLAAIAVVGLVGLYLHNQQRLAEGFHLTQSPLVPPLLAPLALTGLALVGALAIWPAGSHGILRPPRQ